MTELASFIRNLWTNTEITMIIGTNVNLGLKKHLQLLSKTVITSVRSDFAIIKKKWKWS